MKNFITFPLRLNENDFISEMFLFAKIISENLRTLGVEVKKYEIYMLAANEKAAHIDIKLNNGSNVIVSIDTRMSQGILFFFNKQSEACSYAEFRQKGFLKLVNMIKD
jgi:hypothetical protein